MIRSIPPTPSGLSDLEKSGVLMTRMLHELNNHLSILAGHLQIIQLGKRDPDSLAKSWQELKTASDTIGDIVERYVGFRRRVHNEAGFCSLEDLITAVQEGAGEIVPPDGKSGWNWKVNAPHERAGRLQVEPRWVRFAVWETALLSQAHEGQITIFAPGSAMDTRGLKPAFTAAPQTEYLRLLVSWASEKPAYTEEELFRPPVMSLAVVIGIVRWAQGLVSYTFLPPNQSRFWISLPIYK